MLFNKKKKENLDALISATENMRNYFQSQLGDGWHTDIDRAYPCKLGVDAEDCSRGWHPAVLMIPKNQSLLEQFQTNEVGLSDAEGPNMAVFYGCDSGGKAPYTFFLHDIQASAAPFKALGWMVAVAIDPQVGEKSVAKAIKHFERFMQ